MIHSALCIVSALLLVGTETRNFGKFITGYEVSKGHQERGCGVAGRAGRVFDVS